VETDKDMELSVSEKLFISTVDHLYRATLGSYVKRRSLSVPTSRYAALSDDEKEQGLEHPAVMIEASC
jgi:hypothetical protein